MEVSPGYRIVRLGADDIALMRALNARFGEAFDNDHAYSAAPPSDAYLADVLADEGVAVLAAVMGETVVGGLVAYELRKLEQARSEFYVYDLAVSQPYRRRGIATALIEALKPIAKARGAWVVFLQADPPDAPAIALYSSLGVREDVIQFDIALD